MAKRKFHLTQTQLKEFKQHEQQSRRVAELKRLQAVRLYGSRPVKPLGIYVITAMFLLYDWLFKII